MSHFLDLIYDHPWWTTLWLCIISGAAPRLLLAATRRPLTLPRKD